jgi:hypothetical protein
MEKPITLEELPEHLDSIPMRAWDNLFAFIPSIEKAESFGEWKVFGNWPNFVSSKLVDNFIKTVYGMRLIVNFPWMQWEEGGDILRDPQTDYLNLSPETLIKLLTRIVRSDRFSEGAIAGAFEKGTILKILLGLKMHYGVRDTGDNLLTRNISEEEVVSESPTRIERSRKSRKCPSCGHSPLASILYGYVGFDDGLQKKLEEGRIVLGGCCVSDDDPRWECTNCGLKIYKKSPDELLSSHNKKDSK